MQRAQRQLFEPYLACLRQLPFARRVKVDRATSQAGAWAPDGVLGIQTPQGEHRLPVVVKRTHLTYALVEGLLGHFGRAGDGPAMLFAPYVGRPMGRHLAAHGMNYVDAVGNCHVRLGDAYVATIEGKTAPPRAAQGRGLGVPGHQILFAILARPSLLNVPVRTLAEAAGVGKTAAAGVMARLQEDGIVVPGPTQRHVRNRGLLLDRWLAGYANLVRPRLLLGRYRTEDPDPAALERRIEQVLGHATGWAWGGGAAAFRLTQHYRGAKTVLHVVHPATDLARQLRGIPAADGPLVLLRIPGPIALAGVVPHTAHPLLVYTELLCEGGDRAREAARIIRERHLKGLS